MYSQLFPNKDFVEEGGSISMKNRLKRIVITTGALLMMTMAPITQSNPLGQYLNEMSGVITAQAAEQSQFISIFNAI